MQRIKNIIPYFPSSVGKIHPSSACPARGDIENAVDAIGADSRAFAKAARMSLAELCRRMDDAAIDATVDHCLALVDALSVGADRTALEQARPAVEAMQREVKAANQAILRFVVGEREILDGFIGIEEAVMSMLVQGNVTAILVSHLASRVKPIMRRLIRCEFRKLRHQLGTLNGERRGGSLEDLLCSPMLRMFERAAGVVGLRREGDGNLRRQLAGKCRKLRRDFPGDRRLNSVGKLIAFIRYGCTDESVAYGRVAAIRREVRQLAECEGVAEDGVWNTIQNYARDSVMARWLRRNRQPADPNAPPGPVPIL